MACKIIRNPVTKEIQTVLAPNGEDSILFKSIMNIDSVASTEIAALVWAHTYTDNFKKQLEGWFVRTDKNGEPEVVVHNRGKFYMGTRGIETKLIPVFDGVRAGVNSKKIITSDSLALVTLTTLENVTKQESLQDRLLSIVTNSSSKYNKYLASKLQQSLVANNYDIPVYHADVSSVAPTWLGFYAASHNFIGINTAKGDLSDEHLLHEAIHAFTSYSLLNDPLFNAQITKLWNLSKAHLKDKFVHELRNVSEFTAEALTNPAFIEELGKIPVESNKSV